MTTVLLYVTAANRDEAMSIARTLIEERLIACANIIDGATSLYWWQGNIEQTQEAILFAKTHRHNVEQVTVRIQELHSHDCPCVVAMPIETGSPEYLRWIESESTAWDDGRMG